jgi:hypothetical protein
MTAHRDFSRIGAVLGASAMLSTGNVSVNNAAIHPKESVKVENLSGKWVNPFADRNAKAFLFLFVSVECPISNS